MLAALNTIVLAATEAAGAEEEEGGNFLVTPDVGLMIWTLVGFGIALLILQKMAFPRIQEALDKRQRLIEDSIETAERTQREADELLAEYRQRLQDAREQADEIVARARKSAEAAEAATVAEGRAKREELVEQAKRDIETETRRAVQQIRAEVAELTLLATEKVTRKSLTPDDQRRLVGDALAELDFSTLSGSSSSRSQG